MKKYLAIAAGVAMSLAVAVPAFAHHHSSGLTVSNRDTDVSNTVFTASNTGLNVTGGHHSRVTTGDAGAAADVRNSVNYTEVGCGCARSASVSNSDTDVNNLVVTVANTGANFTHGGRVHTGGALAGTVLVNDVNSTVVGGTN